MKIEFGNSIRRLSFLNRLPDIKIAWKIPGLYYNNKLMRTIEEQEGKIYLIAGHCILNKFLYNIK